VMQAGTETKSKWRARKTGRPKQSGEREPSGKLQRANAEETVKQRQATAMAQPHRKHLQASRRIKLQSGVADGSRGTDDLREATDGCRGPADQRASYAFGRMRLQGELTKVQHDALQHWLEAFVRYSRALGLPQVHYGNCLAMNVGGGHDGEEPDAKAATDRAKRAKLSFEALEASMNDHLGSGKTAADVALVHVCLMDREPMGAMAGDLRMAANAVDRHLTGTIGRRVDNAFRL